MKSNHFGLLALLAASLAGCGGGSSSSSSSALGRVTLKVKWPQESRFIPLRANSIVVTLTNPALPDATQTVTIVRPKTTATFAEVPAGTYTIRADARPNADGSGTTQALDTQSGVVVSAGATTTPPDLVLDSEVKRLRLGVTSGAGSSVYTFDASTGSSTAPLVSVTGAAGTGLLYPALTGSGGSTPISATLSALNLTNDIVLVSSGDAGFTFQGTAGVATSGVANGDPTALGLGRDAAGPVGSLKVTYRDRTAGSNTAGQTTDYAVFNLPVLVLRSLAATPISNAATADADPTGASTNDATADYQPLQNLGTAPALDAGSSFSLLGLTGFSAGDAIRVAVTASGKRYAIKPNAANNNILSDTDGNKTIATVSNIFDVAASGNRVFVLAQTAVGRRVLELTISVGSVTVGTTYANDLAGAVNLAASPDAAGTGVLLAVSDTTSVRRFTVGVGTLTQQGTTVSLASANDVALTPSLTFVLDATGKIHTYGTDATEFGLALSLPGGATIRRIAAGVLDNPAGTKRTYLVATSTGLAGNEVQTFVEAGS